MTREPHSVRMLDETGRRPSRRMLGEGLTESEICRSRRGTLESQTTDSARVGVQARNPRGSRVASAGPGDVPVIALLSL